MRRVGATIAVLLTAASVTPAAASTRPTVHDTVKEGGRTIRLSLDISQSGTSHMWVRVKDPSGGIFPYCTTVQFEKRTEDGWKRVGRGSAYDKDCFDSPEDAEGRSETKSYWDNFAYPDGKLKDSFLAGEDIRVHGFTSLGGDVKFAF